MSRPVYRVPSPGGELGLALLLGTAFAFGLFVVMALAQMMSAARPPEQQIDERMIVFTPPEVVEIEEEEPPPPEEEEPPPELEAEPPQLSLDQLDIALNPGTGGSLAGDFSMPSIGTSQSELGTEDFVDFSALDQLPRPIGVTGFNFPTRLKRKKVNGRIVLFIQLDSTGEVLDVKLDSSNLPKFNDFVVNEVRKWRFTPPTQQGRPVRAQARIPIPIKIN